MLIGQNIARELSAWRKQEEEISRLFPTSVVNSRAFQLEKLTQLDTIYYKHAVGLAKGGHDERLMLRMLNIERKKLEKQLYPKIWLRFLRQLVLPLKKNAAIKREVGQRNSNEASIREAVGKAGFGSIDWRLVDKCLRQGEPSFSVRHSQYASKEKHMEYELLFSRDAQGRYQFERYQAALKSNTHPNQNRQQSFSAEGAQHTTASQAFHLLEGRAVQQEYINALGARQSCWVRLDFNDKDSHGNFRRREFHTTMDLEKGMLALPIKEKAYYHEMEKLLQGLRDGEQVAVHLLKEGIEIPVSLETNPQLKVLELYNANGKKVGLTEALGEKKEKAAVVSLPQAQEQKQQRKNAPSPAIKP